MRKIYPLIILASGTNPAIQFLNGDANLEMLPGGNFGVDSPGPTHFEYHGNIHSLIFANNHEHSTRVDFNISVEAPIDHIKFKISGNGGFQLQCQGKISTVPDNNGIGILVLPQD